MIPFPWNLFWEFLGNSKRQAVRRHSLRALEYLLKREARLVMFLAGLAKDTLWDFYLGMRHDPFSSMTDLLNMVIFHSNLLSYQRVKHGGLSGCLSSLLSETSYWELPKDGNLS